MTSTLLTYARTLRMESFKSDLTENSASYIFYSKYSEWPDDNAPPAANSTVESSYAAWREMFYGKKISSSDVAFLIDRNYWTSNTIYDYYTHTANLESLDFYVTTDERKVYKCLFNGYGNASSSKPTATANVPFTSADGYVWKYMFTVSQANIDKFGDAGLTPFEANTTIQDQVQPGAIDIIVVSLSGNNWSATDTGVVQEKISNTVLKIASTAITTNGVYEDSGFYVSSGNGAGFLSSISTYVSNSSGNFVGLALPANDVSFGSSYRISPYVSIDGDGSGARAYSVVNSNTATISEVIVINAGSSYTTATITPMAQAAYSNTSAVLTAIIGPPGGHGSNPLDELCSRRICISVATSNTDTIPSNVSFRTAGLLIAPKHLANSALYTNSEFRQFEYATIALGVGIVDPPAARELIVGQTSGAEATVLWSNTTLIRYADVSGAFANGETIVSNTSSSVATISAINNPQLLKNSGEILYLDNFEPVTRTDVSNEKVRIIVRT